MAFIDMWNALEERINTSKQSKTKKKIIIPKWTAKRGYLKDCITVTGINKQKTAIFVEVENSNSIQIVSKASFFDLYPKWNDYFNRKLPRKTIAVSNFKLSYVISILKWLEGELRGPLP